MKHTVKINSIIILIFILAQIFGLLVVYNYVDQEASSESGELEFKKAPLIERPQIEEGDSYKFMIIAILVGTIMILVLAKLKARRVWKVWFFLAATICLTISFGAFVPEFIAIAMGLILGGLKTYKSNFWIHNITEVFMYGGLAAIFVPIMNISSVIILLIIIAIYDAIAVWQSKHMIKLAKFQTETNLFAGVDIPYNKKGEVITEKKIEKKENSKKVVRTEKKSIKRAILGGGDIGFPLLFAGVIMKSFGWQTLIITITSTISLFLLLEFSKKEKFYPAMPFLGAGCLIGYGLILLIQVI